LKYRALRDPQLEAAVAAFDRGIALFPNDENLLVRKGQALDQLQRFAEAEKAYRRAIELDPNLGAVHGYYAAHLRLRQRLDEADQEQAKAFALAGPTLAPNLHHPVNVLELRTPLKEEE
jgi:Flp pilus assembly protein TadD